MGRQERLPSMVATKEELSPWQMFSLHLKSVLGVDIHDLIFGSRPTSKL
jgi:hypothetical protein